MFSPERTDVLGRTDNKILVPALDQLFLDNVIGAGTINVTGPKSGMRSTDFGNVNQRLPASALNVAFGPPRTPGAHTREWAERTRKLQARKALEVGYKPIAMPAYALLTNEQLFEHVKREFAVRV